MKNNKFIRIFEYVNKVKINENVDAYTEKKVDTYFLAHEMKKLFSEYNLKLNEIQKNLSVAQYWNDAQQIEVLNNELTQLNNQFENDRNILIEKLKKIKNSGN